MTVGTTPDCTKAANPYARNFTLGVAARLRRHGGWRFLEPLGQGISWCVSRHHDSKCLLAIWVAFFESAKQYEDRCGQDGSKCNVTGLASTLEQQLRSLMSAPMASTPHLIHGWGDASNTVEYLLAAYLLVVERNWYFAASGWDGSLDPRFNGSASGNAGQ